MLRSEAVARTNFSHKLRNMRADLPANAEFNLVRQCEDGDCIPWLLDTAKASP